MFWRCIEVEGAGRAGEKNRRPTSHYAVQSCAIETVGRTILRTVGAKKRRGLLSAKGEVTPFIARFSDVEAFRGDDKHFKSFSKLLHM